MTDPGDFPSVLPVGFPLPDWTPVPAPDAVFHKGQYCCLERLSVDHASALYEGYSQDTGGKGWTYLPYGPFSSPSDFAEWVQGIAACSDPFLFAVIDETTGLARGVAGYLRIQPEHGSIEFGHIHFAPELQGKRAGTEAVYLLMKHAFDLGYRRFEWKCDSMNQASRAAALRFGFSYEGLFRQAAVIKGRNRDTAWFAMIDREWPLLREAFEAWLAPENFDADGCQRVRLGAAAVVPVRA
jgi:RimJ/RimL family protein N-acetyltransferase